MYIYVYTYVYILVTYMFICIFSVLLYRYIYEYIYIHMYTLLACSLQAPKWPLDALRVSRWYAWHIFIYVFAHILCLVLYVCCSVLRCVAVCSSVLQCVAVCFLMFSVLCHMYISLWKYIYIHVHISYARCRRNLLRVLRQYGWHMYILVGSHFLSCYIYVVHILCVVIYIYIYMYIYLCTYIHIYICVHICCARFRLSEPVSWLFGNLKKSQIGRFEICVSWLFGNLPKISILPKRLPKSHDTDDQRVTTHMYAW